MSFESEAIARRAKAAFEDAQHHLSSGVEADRQRREALGKIRDELEVAKDAIREANAEDVKAAKEQVAAGKISSALAARLDLFAKPGKWESMLQGVTDVAALPSPLDKVTYARRLADQVPPSQSNAGGGALDLYRITCPIGVLLCIFEARPEVIINITSLAIKSGNAAILKGGKESRRTAAVMRDVLNRALSKTSLSVDLVQTVETREDVAALLQQDRYIDLVIPRGSNELVRNIQREARMPVMGHADGLCAIYIHSDADPSTTIASVVDAKTDYPAACNAVETLLIHRSVLASLWPTLANALLQAGVLLRCDVDSRNALLSTSSSFQEQAAQIVPSSQQDFDTEFLDLELAVLTVDNEDEAIQHINTHGSHHTDAVFCAPLDSSHHANNTSIPTTHPNLVAEKFTRAVTSANVFVNASTRFADGFRYGFGTEVGISTGRTHARGPVGLEGLVIYKYILRGADQGPQTAASFSSGSDSNQPPREWSHSEIPAIYPTF